MAKKRRQQKIILPKSYSSSAQSSRGTLDTLHEAVQSLRRGNADRALQLVTRVWSPELRGGTADYARQIAAEAHFRMAAATANAESALQHLDEALRLMPHAAKLHFHRGIALWKLGRVSEALAEFDTTAEREPGRPKLAYLRQLARLALGQPWDTDGLTEAEANMLRLVAGLIANVPQAELTSLTAGPLIGKDPRFWQALIAMRGSGDGSLAHLLQEAASRIGRKPVSRVLFYYQGVAALLRAEREAALSAWLNAKGLGLSTPWADQNLAYLLRSQALELAEAGKWDDVIALAERLTSVLQTGAHRLLSADRVFAETLGVAYFRAGYEAAQKGQWRNAVAHWQKANRYAPSRYLAQNLALAQEALQNWREAAQAWREMARRRPRKSDHPDYLTDAQVAAIWSHAAECYERAGDADEAITCLKTALNYAPENSELRLKLADTMREEERDGAARTQLEQLLQRDPRNVEALLRLAALYDESWDGDPEPLWRQVLAIQPDNAEAREGLAQSYLARVRADPDKPRFWRLLFGNAQGDKIEILKKGLAEVPDHPRLLLELGKLYTEKRGAEKLAQQHLLRAYQVAPSDAGTAGSVLHQLLHARGESIVQELLPQVSAIPGLLPTFWLDQAQMVLHCRLGRAWAERFFTLALETAQARLDNSTRASVLLQAFEICSAEKAEDLARRYAEQIEREVPDSGAVEYIAAHRAYHEKGDAQGALRLLRKAKQQARKAKDEGVLALAEQVEATLGLGKMGIPGLSRLLEMLPPDFWDEEWDR